MIHEGLFHKRFLPKESTMRGPEILQEDSADTLGAMSERIVRLMGGSVMLLILLISFFYPWDLL
jgi:hypothetical protein